MSTLYLPQELSSGVPSTKLAHQMSLDEFGAENSCIVDSGAAYDHMIQARISGRSTKPWSGANMKVEKDSCFRLSPHTWDIRLADDVYEVHGGVFLHVWSSNDVTAVNGYIEVALSRHPCCQSDMRLAAAQYHQALPHLQQIAPILPAGEKIGLIYALFGNALGDRTAAIVVAIPLAFVKLVEIIADVDIADDLNIFGTCENTLNIPASVLNIG